MIILNIGTTFKGAYDDVERVGARLKPILEKYGLNKRMVEYAPGKFDERTGYWIHVDGALGASYLPFLEKALGRINGHVRDSIFPYRMFIQLLPVHINILDVRCLAAFI